MATMNVSLRDAMKSWVEEKTRSGHFGNASDDARDLTRSDQERQNTITKLQRLIDEGLESGLSPRTFKEILADARDRVGKSPKS